MAFKKITQEDISKTASVREKLRKDGAKIDLTGKTIKRKENTDVTSGASENSSPSYTPGTEKRVDLFERYYETKQPTANVIAFGDALAKGKVKKIETPKEKLDRLKGPVAEKYAEPVDTLEDYNRYIKNSKPLLEDTQKYLDSPGKGGYLSARGKLGKIENESKSAAKFLKENERSFSTMTRLPEDAVKRRQKVALETELRAKNASRFIDDKDNAFVAQYYYYVLTGDPKYKDGYEKVKKSADEYKKSAENGKPDSNLKKFYDIVDGTSEMMKTEGFKDVEEIMERGGSSGEFIARAEDLRRRAAETPDSELQKALRERADNLEAYAAYMDVLDTEGLKIVRDHGERLEKENEGIDSLIGELSKRLYAMDYKPGASNVDVPRDLNVDVKGELSQFATSPGTKTVIDYINEHGYTKETYEKALEMLKKSKEEHEKGNYLFSVSAEKYYDSKWKEFEKENADKGATEYEASYRKMIEADSDMHGTSAFSKTHSEVSSRYNEAREEIEDAKKKLESAVGKEAAEEYYEYVNWKIDQENGKASEEETRKRIDWYFGKGENGENGANPIVGGVGVVAENAVSVGTNIASALYSPVHWIEEAFAKDPDKPFDRYGNVLATYTNAVRESTADNAPNKLTSDLYMTVMSSLDSVAAAYAGGGVAGGLTTLGVGAGTAATIGGWASAGIMGVSAAENAMIDVTARGGTRNQAYAAGFLAGFAEMAFEKWSIGEFTALKESNLGGVKNLFKDLSKSAVVNFSEEGNTEVANILSDYFVNGGYSQYAEEVRNNYFSGYSLEESKSKAAKTLALQVRDAAIGGAMQGVLMAGVGKGSSYLRRDSVGKSIRTFGMTEVGREAKIKSLLNDAKLLPSDSAEYRYAHELELKYSKKGRISDAEIGSLVEMTSRYFAEHEDVYRNAHAEEYALADLYDGEDEKGRSKLEKSILDEALTMPEKTEARALAEQIKAEFPKGEKLGRTITMNLYVALLDARETKTNSEKIDAANNAVEYTGDEIRLIGLGVKPETARKGSEALLKLLNGENLTANEIAVIGKNEVLFREAAEIIGLDSSFGTVTMKKFKEAVRMYVRETQAQRTVEVRAAVEESAQTNAQTEQMSFDNSEGVALSEDTAITENAVAENAAAVTEEAVSPERTSAESKSEVYAEPRATVSEALGERNTAKSETAKPYVSAFAGIRGGAEAVSNAEVNNVTPTSQKPVSEAENKVSVDVGERRTDKNIASPTATVEEGLKRGRKTESTAENLANAGENADIARESRANAGENRAEPTATVEEALNRSREEKASEKSEKETKTAEAEEPTARSTSVTEKIRAFFRGEAANYAVADIDSDGRERIPGISGEKGIYQPLDSDGKGFANRRAIDTMARGLGAEVVYEGKARSETNAAAKGEASGNGRDVKVFISAIEETVRAENKGISDAQIKELVAEEAKRVSFHELGHIMKMYSGEAYDRFIDYAVKLYKAKYTEKRFNREVERLKEANRGMTDSEAREEIACDMIPDILKDEKKLESFTKYMERDRTRFGRFLNAVHELMGRVRTFFEGLGFKARTPDENLIRDAYIEMRRAYNRSAAEYRGQKRNGTVAGTVLVDKFGGIRRTNGENDIKNAKFSFTGVKNGMEDSSNQAEKSNKQNVNDSGTSVNKHGNERIKSSSYTAEQRRIAEQNRIELGVDTHFYRESVSDDYNANANAVRIHWRENGTEDLNFKDGVASFTKERLDSLISEYSVKNFSDYSKDYAKAYVAYISPDEFISLTATNPERIKSEATDKYKSLNEESLKQSGDIYLIADFSTGEVEGHEGRHRMILLKNAGINKVAVVIRDSRTKDAVKYHTDKITGLSLSGQTFGRERKAPGRVTISEAIPLSPRYREEVTEKFVENKDIGVKYSTVDTTKITPDMSDEERAEVLSNKNIIAPEYNGQADSAIEANAENLRSEKIGLVKKAIVSISEQFDIVGKNISIEDVGVEITLSKSNLKESISKKATPEELVKLLPVLEDSVSHAIGIERHDNRYYFDSDTVYFENLLGGFNEGEYFVPVRFGLKHSKTGNATLYVVVNQNKIAVSDITQKKETEVVKTAGPNETNQTASRSVGYSISQIIPFVKNKDLLRYLPDNMLDAEQKNAKWEAIAETIKATSEKNDRKYAEYIASGNLEAANEMVVQAARKAGYNSPKLYHGTNADFWEFDSDFVGKTYDSDTEGFFFTDSRSTAENVALDAISNAEERNKELSDQIRETYEEIYGDELSDDELDSLVREKIGEESEDIGSKRVIEAYISLKNPLEMYEDNSLFGTYDVNKENILEEYHRGDANGNDYDGIIVHQAYETMYVVFDPNQIKSADTVTYDGNGDVIPLSERFNDKNSDIRYSTVDTTKQGEETEKTDTDTEEADRLTPEYNSKGQKVSAFAETVADVGMRLNEAGRTEEGADMVETANRIAENPTKNRAGVITHEKTAKLAEERMAKTDEGKSLQESIKEAVVRYDTALNGKDGIETLDTADTYAVLDYAKSAKELGMTDEYDALLAIAAENFTRAGRLVELAKVWAVMSGASYERYMKRHQKSFNKQLRKKLSKMKQADFDEAERLGDEKAKREAKLEDAKNKLADVNEEIRRREAELARLKAEYAEKNGEGESAETAKKLLEAEKKLEASERERAEAEKNAEKARKEAEAAKEKLDKAREALEEAEAETKENEAKIAELAKKDPELAKKLTEEKGLKNRIKNLEKLMEKYAEEYTGKAGEAKKAELEKRIETLKGELERKQAEKDKILEKYTALRKEVRSLEGRNKTLNKNLEKLASGETEADLRRKLKELETLYFEKHDAYEALNKQLAALNDDIRKIREGKNGSMGLDELRRIVASEEAKLSRRGGRLESLRHDIIRYQSLLEALTERRVTAEETLEEVRKAMQGAKNDLLTLARLRKGLGNNAPITIGRNLIENYRKAETAEDRREAAQAIVTDLMRQVPHASLFERLTALRHVRMLLNVKTVMRNVQGNVLNYALTRFNDNMAVLPDYLAHKLSNQNGNHGYERTKASPWTKLMYSEGVNNYFAALSKKAVRKANEALHPIKTAKGLLNNSLHQNGESEVLKFLEEDADRMQRVLQGKKTTGEQGEDIIEMFEEQRRIFRFRLFEAERKLSNASLETPDLWFLRSAYKNALLSTLAARKIDISDLNSEDAEVRETAQKALDSARTYAIRRAQEATFREKNRAADMLNDFRKNPIGLFLMDSVMPYVKTPVNVAKQSITNSPFGLAWIIADGIKSGMTSVEVRKAIAAEARASTDAQKARAAEARAVAEQNFQTAIQKTIEDAAKTVTGSALYFAGYALAKGIEVAGMNIKLRFGGGDDDDYEDLLGLQIASLTIGFEDGAKVNVQLSQFAPVVVPLIMGAATREQLDDGAKEANDSFFGWLATLGNVGFAAYKTLNEMTVLSSLSDLLEDISKQNGTSKDKDDELSALAAITSLGSGILQQLLVSTWFSHFTKAAFGSGMRSYYNSTDDFGGLARAIQKKFINRIGGLGNLIAEHTNWENIATFKYVDEWGRTSGNDSIFDGIMSMKSGRYSDGIREILRAVDVEMLRPIFINQVIETEADKEIARLKEALGSHIYVDGKDSYDIYPTTAKKKIDIDGESRQLSAREYEKYATAKGKTQRELIEKALKREDYKSLDDGEKAKLIKSIYLLADKTAADEVLGDEYISHDNLFNAIRGKSLDEMLDALVYQNRASEARKENGGSLSEKEKSALLLDLDYSDESTVDIWKKMIVTDEDSKIRKYADSLSPEKAKYVVKYYSEIGKAEADTDIKKADVLLGMKGVPDDVAAGIWKAHIAEDKRAKMFGYLREKGLLKTGKDGIELFRKYPEAGYDFSLKLKGEGGKITEVLGEKASVEFDEKGAFTTDEYNKRYREEIKKRLGTLKKDYHLIESDDDYLRQLAAALGTEVQGAKEEIESQMIDEYIARGGAITISTKTGEKLKKETYELTPKLSAYYWQGIKEDNGSYKPSAALATYKNGCVKYNGRVYSNLEKGKFDTKVYADNYVMFYTQYFNGIEEYLGRCITGSTAAEKKLASARQAAKVAALEATDEYYAERKARYEKENGR